MTRARYDAVADFYASGWTDSSPDPSILHPCFPGGGPGISGSWPTGGRYADEGRWVADGEQSTLRRQVGANHRMLSTYLNTLRRHGLVLDAVAEPDPGPDWTGERAIAARYPVYLVVRCVPAR